MQFEHAKIVRIIELIAASTTDDEALVSQLMAYGSSRIEAELLTCFAPLAFGRVLIGKMPSCIGFRLSSFVEVPSADSNRVKIELENIYIYKCLFSLAADAVNQRAWPAKTILNVALRSAEIQIVNQLLLEKEDLSNFSAAPTFLMRIDPEWIDAGKGLPTDS